MKAARVILPTVAGDILLLIGFAALGRASHDETQGATLNEAVVVAAPFVAGWFVAGSLLGAFSPKTIRDRSIALRRVPPAWLLGGSLGLVLRAVVQHRAVPATFDAIALAFNLATLTAWRYLMAMVTE